MQIPQSSTWSHPPKVVQPTCWYVNHFLVKLQNLNIPLNQPLRLSGGTNGYAALTGSGPIGVFYFYQGQFVGAETSNPSLSSPALIGAIPTSGGCSTYGQLGFTSSSSDKCSLRNTFGIQSDTENSQLGAQLVFNYVGGFYACGSGLDVSLHFVLVGM